MQKKTVFIIVAMLGLAAGIALLCRSRVPISARPVGGAAPAASDSGPTASPGQRASSAAVPPVAPPQRDKALENLRLGTLNHLEIVFYGKVIDQDGKPLVGAEVNATTSYRTGLRSGQERFQTVTDSRGRFAFRGHKGESIGIVPRMAGYALATTNTYFVYSGLSRNRHLPDPAKPVPFRLWRLTAREPLLQFERELRITNMVSPVLLDLTTGALVREGGDLKLTLSRQGGRASWKTPIDWSMTIEPVDGGLIETDVATWAITYQAPTNGYAASYRLAMHAADAQWQDGISLLFLFVKSRQGMIHAKLTFNMMLNQEESDPIRVWYRGFANTNGSRNWEATARP